MEAMAWSEEHRLGVDLMDEQHQELFRFAAECLGGESASRVVELFEELVGYAEFHFSSEEELMSACAYPHADVHAAEHMKLLRDGQAFKDRLKGEADVPMEEIADFLKHWLPGHVLGMDKVLAEFLKTGCPLGHVEQGDIPATQPDVAAPAQVNPMAEEFLAKWRRTQEVAEPSGPFKWSETLNIGNKQIDDQHKQLLNICNDLVHAVRNRADRGELTKIMSKLREYTIFHFNDEMALQEKSGYPYRGEHKQVHEQLKHAVMGFQGRLFHREEIEADKIIIFVKGWLVEHILRFDMAFGQYLRDGHKGGDPAAPRKKSPASGQPETK